MKSGALIFIVAFATLSASWGGFVLAPQLQLGRSVQTNELGSGAAYPVARSGMAHQGAEVYRANGCVYCHSQQAGQDGTRCDVVLVELGTNAAATLAVLTKLHIADPATLPAAIMQVPAADAADATLKQFSKVGAKVELHVIPTGPDMARGWGRRGSVAQDYLYEYPVQLGTRRIGPDLANVGSRMPNATWHLLHLYAPAGMTKGSTMPPYRFLFEKRKIGKVPSPDALQLPAESAPADGYEIVPKPAAMELAAYLVSLHADAPLYEAPLTVPTPPAAPTNAPAATAAAK